MLLTSIKANLENNSGRYRNTQEKSSFITISFYKLHTFIEKVHIPLKASQLQNIVSQYQTKSPTASSCRLSCSLSVCSSYTMSSTGTEWYRAMKKEVLSIICCYTTSSITKSKDQLPLSLQCRKLISGLVSEETQSLPKVRIKI